MNGRCQPSPRNPSFAQSVSFVPGPQSETARNHITQSETTKIGSARILFVTTLSILSDSVSVFAPRFFATALPTSVLMKS